MAATDVQRFGPYVILDRIGDGGMAEIFLAKMQGYSGFEKLIALKRILPRYSQNRTFAQMLIHEAKLAASLQHFNVVQVLDLGEIDRQVFIAMEYVRGRDLAAVLSNTYRRKEKLPVALSLCIATEFMTGLDYAHRIHSAEGVPLGIIHRDISPQNILISYEGEVKVTDFGIARVIAEKDGFQLPGNLHGKFGYMSPEQVMGQEIDQRSDIFSAGVVLYEMLTGQRLFRGRDHKDTIKMIVSHVIPPPSSSNPEVPPSVDRICAKTLARDRNTRYQTVGALLGDLSRVADSLPRRAATRDLSVYMRRQFGTAAGGFASRNAPKSDRSQSVLSSISSFSGQSSPGVSSVGGVALASGVRIPLGEILIDQGAITAGELEIALAEQRARGGRIGELLVASGNISEEALLRALSTQSGLPSISQEDLTGLPPPSKLLKRFPREAAEATMMLPLSVNEEERSVRLAVNDPYDDRAILETKVVLGVSEVVVFLAKRSAIRAAIARWYGEEPEAETPEEPIFSAPAEAPEAQGPPVVLIADGNPSTLDDLVARIREEDCEVILVADGKRARDVCREMRPAVAFLDAALPGIDGFNILLELRSRNADAAVFITSSRGDEVRQAKALELGADDFIVKPFGFEVTTAKIRREIQKRSGGKRIMAQPVKFEGVSGSLKDMTFLDIIQGLELGKKSAHVVLQYEDGRNGELSVRGGDLKGCIAGEQVSEEAFYLLVRPGDGLFRIEYRPSPIPENITKPNTFLMIEAMRRLDEAERRRDPRPIIAGERGDASGHVPSEDRSIDGVSRATKPPTLESGAPRSPAFGNGSSSADARDSGRGFSSREHGVESEALTPVTDIAALDGGTRDPLALTGAPEPIGAARPEVSERVSPEFLEPTFVVSSSDTPATSLRPLGQPMREWSDSAAGWEDAVAAWENRPSEIPHSPTLLPLAGSRAAESASMAGAGGAPVEAARNRIDFSALAGDLVLEGDAPSSARPATAENGRTGSGGDASAPGEDPGDDATSIMETGPSAALRRPSGEYFEAPTRIARVPIRRVSSTGPVEHIKDGISDPASNPGRTRPIDDDEKR